MRGFIQGSLWGVVLGGAGLSLASLVNDLPDYAEGPPAPQLTVPELDLAEPGLNVNLQAGSDASPRFSPAVPLGSTADDPETAPDVSTETAAPPQAADVADVIDAPEVTQEPDLSSTMDAPVTAQVETERTRVLTEQDAVAVDTTPPPALPAEAPTETPVTGQEADPVVPDVVAEEVMEEPAVAEVEDAAEEEAVPQEPAVTDPSTAQSDAAVAEDETPVTEAPEEDNLPVAAEAEETATTETADAPADSAVLPAPPETEAAPAETALAQALPQVTTSVRINRPGASDEVAESPPNEMTSESVIPDDAPALLRFAAPFENPQDVPLISIILIDSGEMPDAAAAVADLGFVPTVVVNGLSASSTALVTAYRASGIEVAMQADLPEGAEPTDVEVAFEAAMALVPEVAMLFSDGTGAMQDRNVTAQVMQILADKGQGFVAVQRGLNNAARAAEQVDVPTATVLRDIDGAGEDSRAILRALDQAAFRARQSGNAVLLGRVTPQTLGALRDWAGNVDPDTLAIAPVSAILLSE